MWIVDFLALKNIQAVSCFKKFSRIIFLMNKNLWGHLSAAINFIDCIFLIDIVCPYSSFSSISVLHFNFLINGH